jgi:hypothetical protein
MNEIPVVAFNSHELENNLYAVPNKIISKPMGMDAMNGSPSRLKLNLKSVEMANNNSSLPPIHDSMLSSRRTGWGAPSNEVIELPSEPIHYR